MLKQAEVETGQQDIANGFILESLHHDHATGRSLPDLVQQTGCRWVTARDQPGRDINGCYSGAVSNYQRALIIATAKANGGPVNQRQVFAIMKSLQARTK